MRDTSENIFIVGMTATGKSTVGRIVAQLLGFEFIDSDTVIEERCGASISWIFEIEGESKFRDRESTVLDEVTRQNRIVLATGGGAILREANRMLLRRRGWVVCLESTIPELIRRVHDKSTRPMLNQYETLEESLEKMVEQREALYTSVADKTFTSYGDDKSTVAHDIVKWFRERR